MTLTGMDQHVVPGAQAETRPVLECELGLTGEQRHPLVPLLVEPLPCRCRLPGRQDSLHEDPAGDRQPLEHLLG